VTVLIGVSLGRAQHCVMILITTPDRPGSRCRTRVVILSCPVRHSQSASSREDGGDRDDESLFPAGLLSLLAQMADPRKRRGVRHTVIAVALAATPGGARSFAAIAEWAADGPAEALTRV
jgi:hypothetical protein